MFETGNIVRGNDPNKGKTGQGRAVKVINVSGQLFGLSSNGNVYHLNKLDFFDRPISFKSENAESTFKKEVQELEQLSARHPKWGFEIGDVFSGLVFVGYDEKRKNSKFFKVSKDEEDGNSLNITRYEDSELIKLLTTEKTKNLTVYYFNEKGEKIKTDVDSMSDIKDMKELIFKIEN